MAKVILDWKTAEGFITDAFIGAGVPVYEGMVVGSSPKTDDLVVNVCKRKHATNTRASGSDDALKLTPPRQLSLEQCLDFITCQTNVLNLLRNIL